MQVDRLRRWCVFCSLSATEWHCPLPVVALSGTASLLSASASGHWPGSRFGAHCQPAIVRVAAADDSDSLSEATCSVARDPIQVRVASRAVHSARRGGGSPCRLRSHWRRQPYH